MLLAEDSTDGLGVFKSQAPNGTSDVIHVDERLRLEGLLYTLCTALSFIILIFITSFAFLEANRSLLNSRGCIRVVDTQSSLRRPGTMGRIVVPQAPHATKSKNIVAVTVKRRPLQRGYDVSRILLYMITFMHWIRRQPLLPSIRVFDVIRLVPYLRSFNGTSTARPTLTPELSQSGRTRKISSSTQQTTSQRERSLITRNEIIGETSERPSSFKHRDVNRQASVEVMESSTQTTDSPSIHRRRCGEESDLSCASNPPPWWNGVCRSKRDLSRPCRGSSSLCPEPCNSYLDDHYKANFCGEDITGTTPITDAARVGQSDDSWRELRELIDQAVNRTRWAPSACTCCGSQHVAPSRAFVSSQSQTEDERLIAPAALGFPQMDTIPSANVLDTLLSWNSIWSNVESDNVLHSASCLSPSSAPGAFESATSQPWANDSLKGVTHSKIRWAPSVQVGQGGANHNSGPLNVPVQSCPTPIGSLRHRRIEDRIQPSIWSPTWQPSSSDPEFAVTSSLMLYSSAEGRFNERPFPTFLRNTVNGLSEGNICTNRRAPVQNDMGSAIIQESNFSLPEINRPSILAVAGSSKSTLPAARISSAASKTS